MRVFDGNGAWLSSFAVPGGSPALQAGENRIVLRANGPAHAKFTAITVADAVPR